MRALRTCAALLLVAALLCGTALAYPTKVVYEDLRQSTGESKYAMLAALGIMEGDGTGNFYPDRSITRAEMAKIVAVLHSGGRARMNLVETPFTDLSGHWAANYVGYCYENGLISGTSGTTFSPDATITDYECVKMLLAVRGYPFTEGDDWREQVNAHIAGQYALSGAVWSRQVIATQVHDALTFKLYESEKRLFEENFGLTQTHGQIVATDELALKGEVQEKGHFVLETEEGMKTFSYGYFDYTMLGRSIYLYHDAADALVMVFFEASVSWITGGKCDVFVEGQSVRLETQDDRPWYRRTFTDAEWDSEVLFIHNFGAVQSIKISELFDESKGYVTGMNTDRVVFGYSNMNEQPFLYALSFTNTLEKVGEIDNVRDCVQLGGVWHDIGSLDGAKTGDFVVYAISGADNKAYMAKLEQVTIEVVGVVDGIVETADGSYRIADGMVDPNGLLLSESAFPADETCVVYILRDIIFVKA